jgi:RimJ/RimL family protein N-acetyltransferase
VTLVGSPVTLTGRQLELVPFTPACITGEYLGWLNDRELMRYSRHRFTEHTPTTALAYLAGFPGTPSHFWSIRRLGGSRAVGTASARVDGLSGVADMGFLVGEPGKGIGRETCELVIDFLLRHAGLRKVTGGTLRANAAMVRIFEDLGMCVEGVQREQELVEGHPCDVVLFGLLASEWRGEPIARVARARGAT